jgi:hypothetical protein
MLNTKSNTFNQNVVYKGAQIIDSISSSPGANVIKLFTDSIVISKTLATAIHFHPSLLFVGRAGAYKSGAP